LYYPFVTLYDGAANKWHIIKEIPALTLKVSAIQDLQATNIHKWLNIKLANAKHSYDMSEFKTHLVWVMNNLSCKSKR